MKHLTAISAAKVNPLAGEDLSAILDQVFGFISDLVEQKGKSDTPEE